MVSSTGILDGHMRPAAGDKRRRASKYRLFGIIVSVILALWLGSCLSHSIHHERRPDLRKRHAFDEPLGFNDSHALLRSSVLVPRAVTESDWQKKVTTGHRTLVHDEIRSGAAGGVTANVLQETGWEEDDEVDITEAESWRKPLGQADGRLNAANEVQRWWTHNNDWRDGQGNTRRELIDAALAKVGRGEWQELPDWPGVDFEPSGNLNKKPYRPETEAFLGLLASAHGAGPAYLLIQYRNIFGKKRIPKIKLWKSSIGPNMLLYVEDV
ncbi:hypothetical protein PG997_009919 [Apiospora hydei]|uniref:Uncharacterized protein n=1 Tax=Apiospora hydei TaxID=1337664 RepID=A0ABR1VVH7_9PEZI